MLDGETMPDPSQNRELGGHPARDGRRPRPADSGDPRGAGLGIESQSVKGAGRSLARKHPPIWGGPAPERPRSRSGNLYS